MQKSEYHESPMIAHHTLRRYFQSHCPHSQCRPPRRMLPAHPLACDAADALALADELTAAAAVDEENEAAEARAREHANDAATER